MILSFISLLFFRPAIAEDYLNHVLLLEPEVQWALDSGAPADLKNNCAKMKFNYLDESAKLSLLKKQLHKAVENPLTDDQGAVIQELKKQIRVTTERLIHLARPEWNSEVLKFRIRWMLPDNLSRQTVRFQRFNIQAAYYKGEPANTAIPYLLNFELMWLPQTVFYEGPLHFLDFYGKGTYLEVCQYLPTLEIEVEGQFNWIDWPSVGPFTKLFFLRGRAP